MKGIVVGFFSNERNTAWTTVQLDSVDVKLEVIHSPRKSLPVELSGWDCSNGIFRKI